MRNLTRSDAVLRSESILPGIEYSYYLNFKKGKAFHGHMSCTFALQKLANVFIDFSGKEIVSFQLNEFEPVTSKDEISKLWNQGKLQLKAEWLQTGKNSLSIRFNNEYNTDGNGLHTFTDTDNKQYLYTQSEPYYFNLVMPVFDQPDLKGRVSFSIMHPKDWLVISNSEQEAQFQDLGHEFISKRPFLSSLRDTYPDDFTGNEQWLTIFAKTKRISSYLFSLVLGPYEFVELPKAQRFKNIPMRVYYRKSIEEFAIPQSQMIFEVSKKGIEFYENFFEHEYPFSKWDSAYCPEFNVGAMEYPGIVTYADRLIAKEAHPARSRLSSHIKTILHEMAHMWFGNYVTMRWWDGLWLNESFADFMNFKSFADIQESFSFATDDAWSMMNSRKNWGYSEDSKSTTHPIDCEVVDTKMAESIFDGITYSKGCAVLKQLFYLIGEDLFKKNIKSYFEEFKWKNTELRDLMRHLGNGHSAMDLKDWNHRWIEKAGTNTVKVVWDPSQEGVQKVTVLQGALLPEHPTLRQHKIDLAFYTENGEVGLLKTIMVEAKEETVFEIENKGLKAVLPNANDWGFMSIILDETSQNFFLKHLPKLEELSQLLIIRSLFNDVKQAKVKGDEFVKTLTPVLEANLGNPTIVKELGEYLSAALYYIPPKIGESLEADFFDEIWKMVGKVEDPMILKELRSLLIPNITLGRQCEQVYKALYKQNKEGEKLTFDKRLTANINYFTMLFEGVDPAIVETAKKRILEKASEDENFKNRRLTMESFSMSLEEKIKLWNEEVVNPKRTRSRKELVYTLLGLRTKHNSEKSKRYFLKEYFDRLVEVIRNEDKEISDTFIHYALPVWDDVEFVKSEYERVLPQVKELGNENALRIMQKKIDNFKVRLKTFELYK